MRTLLIFLLSASTCFGQLTIQQMQPFFNGSKSGIVADLTSVLYRWVASDLTTNTAVVSWVDRIQGSIWTNGATANRPTNSATGVWFDNTHWLTNSGLTGMGSNFSLAFICNIQDIGFFSSTAHTMLINNNNLAAGVRTMRIGGDSPTTWGMDITSGALSQFQMSKLSPFRSTNVVVDILFNQVTTNLNKWSMYYYTNNIQDNKVDFSSGSYMGTTDTTVNNPIYFGVLGHFPDQSIGPKMFIQEVWMWTNGTPGTVDGTVFPTQLRNNFHQYATNTYGFSP